MGVLVVAGWLEWQLTMLNVTVSESQQWKYSEGLVDEH